MRFISMPGGYWVRQFIGEEGGEATESCRQEEETWCCVWMTEASLQQQDKIEAS